MAFSHTYQLEIPANTPRKDAKRFTQTYREGSMIDAIVLHVPLGHAGLQRVWIELNGAKIFPSDGSEYELDDVSDLELLRGVSILLPATTEIALVGYNLDDQFTHKTTLIVRGRYAHEAKGER